MSSTPDARAEPGAGDRPVRPASRNAMSSTLGARTEPGAGDRPVRPASQNAMSLTLVIARMIPIMMTPRKLPINRMATGSIKVRSCFIRRVLFSS